MSLGAVPPAEAQLETDPALAQELFRQGRQHTEAGRLEAACAAFEESYAHDPATGTLHNMAACHERLGRLARAWAEYAEVIDRAVRARDADRERVAREQADALYARLPRLTVSIPSRLWGLDAFVFSVDGKALGAAAASTEIPLDLGEHEVSARAIGHQSWNHTLTITAEGQRVAVAVPVLEPLAPANPPDSLATHSTAPSSAAPSSDALAAEPTAPPSAWKTGGYIVGGIGLASLGVGAYFGVQAIHHKDERDELCRGGCTQAALNEHKNAEDSAMLANLFVGAGTGLLTTGLLMLLLAPGEAAPSSEVIVSAEPQSAGLSIRGVW